MELIILLLLTLSPSIAIMMYVHLKDKFDKEPRRLLIYSFIGGCLSVLPAIMIERELGSIMPRQSYDLIATFLYTFVVIALTEEFCKYIFITLYSYRQKEFNEPYDGIIYSVMVGMGFATIENIKYVMEGGVSVAILRMFTAVPAHAIFGVVMGYYLGKAKFADTKNKVGYFAIALIAPVIFHGGYNFFLIQRNYPVFFIGGFLIVMLGLKIASEAIETHSDNSPFKKMVEAVKGTLKK